MRVHFLALAVGTVIATRLLACPFCTSSGQTLSQEAVSSAMILFGWPKNPRFDPNTVGQGTTDLEIEVVVKNHEILAGRSTITIPKYLAQPDPKKPMKYLVFCDVYKGQIDPYRGTPYKPDSHIATYLKGALALRDKDVGTRLRFFFGYLDDPDDDVSRDALTEFGNADYKEYRHVAEKFPAEKVIGWLKDPGTAPSRIGLYGSMLGHCGKQADAAVLQAIIDDPNRQFVGGLDGVYAGLTLLDPERGWKVITDTLGDGKRDFLVRYAALRSARFFWEYRPDVIGKDRIAAGLTALLGHADIADLAIEDLRKWQCWKAGNQVFALIGKPSHDSLLIRRAVLRYMLRCPAGSCPAGAAWLAEQRKTNPKWVEDVESLLNAETAPLPAAAGKSK